MEIFKLSDKEFKTLVVRLLKDLIEYVKSLREEMKALLREIKKNPQDISSEVKEVQINDLEHKEEINIQPELNEETRIQKNKQSLRRLWDISKRANIQIIGMPEGEEKEQEIENLFEKIMKENFPNLVKEIDIQVLEAQRVPKKLDPKKATPRHIVIKISKFKDKERILKVAREENYLQRSSHECQLISNPINLINLYLINCLPPFHLVLLLENSLGL